jgi:hypothetical protein
MSIVANGVIGPRQAQFLDVVLQSGHTYSIYVHAEDPSVDFDLHVLDENGVLVNWDESPAADAYCAITPAWTGPFRLVVDSKRGISPYRVQVQE